MRYSWLLLLVLMLVHPVQAEPQPATDAIPMRLAAIHKGDVSYVQLLTRLARTVEENSNKQLRPELFANGKKGSEEQALQELSQGNLEGGFFATLTLARHLPAFRALATPLLFTRPEQLRTLFDSPLDHALREYAKSKNLLVLGYASYGFYGLLNFRPAPSGKPPTWNGLTTRVPNDPWMLELHHALGVHPSILPAADLSEAIHAAWIQGIAATPELLNRTAFANANATAFHHTRHLHGWTIFAVNLNWFHGLPPQHQETIQKAATTLFPAALDQAMAQEQKILNKWTTENHFPITTPASSELATGAMKGLAQKNAQEMEQLLNQPGVVVQLWNQNQLPTRSATPTKPRTTP
ncbi:MAG: hypothetical protein G8237_08270 [Magnetococcales bacterium]|nr:hypothetical protein [Magnetococcales bacterium]